MADKQVQEEPIEKVEAEMAAKPSKKPLLKKYTFPDIDHGGPSVTIEATSIEEATTLYYQQKGQTK